MTCRKKKGRVFTNAIACLLGLTVAIAAHAQTIVELRVDGDQGSAIGDGSDWGPLAFKFLQESSAPARMLVNDEVTGYQFKEWEAVLNSHPEYYLNLKVVADEGREVGLIWLVDLDKKTAEPKSQEARELVARLSEGQ